VFPVTLSPYHLVTLSLLLTVGCDWPGKPKPENRPVPEDQVMDFWKLYTQNCAGCHGAKGELGPAPPLKDALFLAIVPDEVLLQVITAGRPGTLMPAFARSAGGPLTEAQVKVLAEGLKPRWGQSGGPPEGVPAYSLPEQRPTPKPQEKPTDAPRPEKIGAPKGVEKIGEPKGLEKLAPPPRTDGAQVFARACAACHGQRGEGVQDGNERTGTLNDPVFLSLISDQALRRLVITGRSDLGMPNYAEPRPKDPNFKPLNSQEVAALVALLASWRSEGLAAGP
jgi:mono/diheme cytochrome c family protein